MLSAADAAESLCARYVRISLWGEADTVPYSKYVTGCRYPFQQLHSRETTEWVTLVQDQDAKPCAIEKRTIYGGLLRAPGISITLR